MLLTRADNAPNVLFIWDASSLSLFAALIQVLPCSRLSCTCHVDCLICTDCLIYAMLTVLYVPCYALNVLFIWDASSLSLFAALIQVSPCSQPRFRS
jgi:hypothetical protein